MNAGLAHSLARSLVSTKTHRHAYRLTVKNNYLLARRREDLFQHQRMCSSGYTIWDCSLIKRQRGDARYQQFGDSAVDGVVSAAPLITKRAPGSFRELFSFLSSYITSLFLSRRFLFSRESSDARVIATMRAIFVPQLSDHVSVALCTVTCIDVRSFARRSLFVVRSADFAFISMHFGLLDFEAAFTSFRSTTKD